jgi:chromosomal replication initiator protein
MARVMDWVMARPLPVPAPLLAALAQERIAHADLEEKALAAAQQVLAEHICRKDPVVHNSDIVSTVAEYFGVTVTDIHSVKKDRTISLARSFGMYLTRRFTKMSYPEIGKAMGNKNHATVILACRKVEQYLKTNSQIKWQHKNGWRNVQAEEALDSLIEKIS